MGEDGPCYRCVFPNPPAKETVGTCEEVGVLGAVTGVIGTLQAMEAIKIIIGKNGESGCLYLMPCSEIYLPFVSDPRPPLLIFSALSTPSFRSIKLRRKRSLCPGCSEQANGKKEIKQTDYVAFCGGPDVDLLETGATLGKGRIKAKVKCRIRREDFVSLPSLYRHFKPASEQENHPSQSSM